MTTLASQRGSTIWMALSPDFVISKASLENHILGTDWPCGCDEEAACSSDYDGAGSRLLDSFDEGYLPYLWLRRERLST